MKRTHHYLIAMLLALCLWGCNKKPQEKKTEEITKSGPKEQAGNPIIKDKFTADPAAWVHNDTVYLYVGHDEQEEGKEGFVMNDWYIYSSPDMVHWTSHGAGLHTSDFSWASGQAWAAHVVEKDGKFFWYVTVEHDSIPGKSIGIAVSDHPTGPFKDALGHALITNDMTTQTDIGWDDIDPAVFIDDNGDAYLYWGNTVLKYAKLKDNMIELDGDIHTIDVPEFTEGPWVFKRDSTYYLTYSARFPEEIDYATADGPEGPWTAQGLLNGLVPNSPTNHQAVIEFKDNWYFIYHNAELPGGGEFRRSVAVDKLYFNEDGTIKPIEMTSTGITVTP